MKIVTWNCNGALRKKFEYVISLKADIYVIQECENPAETKSKEYKEWANNYLWTGSSKNKGLGIFVTKNLKIKQLNWSCTYKDHDVKHFLPCSINEDFELLAVWTHENKSPNFGYIGQFWKYIQNNKKHFKKMIIVGDFNSNTIWDQWDRWWNHSDVVRELKEIGIESLYHKFTNEEQGKETQPTFFLQRNFKKPYHIDYCFGSSHFVKKLKFIEVQNYENWKHLSDHTPLLIKLDL